VQADRVVVLGEDARLDRPDVGSFGGGDRFLEQALSKALAAASLGDVDRVLDDAAMDAAIRDGPDGRPADNFAIA
jgi:hypothetical protein